MSIDHIMKGYFKVRILEVTQNILRSLAYILLGFVVKPDLALDCHFADYVEIRPIQ